MSPQTQYFTQQTQQIPKWEDKPSFTEGRLFKDKFILS